MKIMLALILMLFVSVLVNAQSKQMPPDTVRNVRLDGPRKLGAEPLYILNYQGKTFSIDSVAIKNGVIPSGAINSLDLVIDKNALEKYGNAAKNGAIVLTLIEEQNSKTFRSIKKYLKEIPRLTR
jgi:hypothetical protein